MNYEIIKKSWSKRRKPDQVIEIKSIELDNFVKQHNSFCQMRVIFDNEVKQSFSSRVIYNELTKRWIVDGMHVAIRLIENN